MLFPTGYGTTLVDIDTLFRQHHQDKMHPEFARRLRAWLIGQEGKIGIGGSWRSVQPAKPGFAPEGKSFHQSQQFAGGRIAFCAVDLVHVNPGGKHRSPSWAEVPKQGSAEAKRWGVHCNVDKEPWHMQPIEIDGFAGWVSRGRKDFGPIVVPGPAVVAAYPGSPVGRGAQGDAVKLIQKVVGATPDGDFGSVTERRVMAWQKVHGLKDDGVVGVVTWKAMFG